MNVNKSQISECSVAYARTHYCYQKLALKKNC